MNNEINNKKNKLQIILIILLILVICFMIFCTWCFLTHKDEKENNNTNTINKEIKNNAEVKNTDDKNNELDNDESNDEEEESEEDDEDDKDYCSYDCKIENREEFINELTKKGYVKLEEANGNFKKLDVDTIMKKAESYTKLSNEEVLFLWNEEDAKIYRIYEIEFIDGKIKLYKDYEYPEDELGIYVKDILNNIKEIYYGSWTMEEYSTMYALTNDNILIYYDFSKVLDKDYVGIKYDLSGYDGNIYSISTYRHDGEDISLFTKKGNTYYKIGSDYTISNDENLAFYQDSNSLKVFTNGSYSIENKLSKYKVGYISSGLDLDIEIIPKGEAIVMESKEEYDSMYVIYNNNTYVVYDDGLDSISNNFDGLLKNYANAEE